ncbi:MAG: hypothetical protein K8I00_03520, partial [Candidatus Omnitrophica bacterium]|nr:hypothetical protein [Candidatus Omnitrophota bacterium]
MMGDIDEWELDTDNTQDMEPLRVLLRPVWDLLRGPLFPLQSVQQANSVEDLRAQMQVELEAYIRRETADFQPPPTTKPYMLKTMVDYFSCTKADDFEVFANAKPEIYGYIKLWHNGNLVATPLDISESSPEEMDTKGVLMTNQTDKQASVILIPEYYKDGGGRWQVRYPETKMKVTWKITEDDTSGDTLVSSSFYEYTRSRNSGYEAGAHTELKDFGKSGAGSYQISVSFVPEVLNPVSEKSAHQHPNWNDF